MPSRLKPGQQEVLLEALKNVDRTEAWFAFGPMSRKEAAELYGALDSIAVGYFGSYSTKPKAKEKDGVPEEVFVHVAHRQANKLSVVLAGLGVHSEVVKAKTIEANEAEMQARHEKARIEAEQKALQEEQAKKTAKVARIKKAREVKAKKTDPAAKPGGRWSRFLDK